MALRDCSSVVWEVLFFVLFCNVSVVSIVLVETTVVYNLIQSDEQNSWGIPKKNLYEKKNKKQTTTMFAMTWQLEPTFFFVVVCKTCLCCLGVSFVLVGLGSDGRSHFTLLSQWMKLTKQLSHTKYICFPDYANHCFWTSKWRKWATQKKYTHKNQNMQIRSLSDGLETCYVC